MSERQARAAALDPPRLERPLAERLERRVEGRGHGQRVDAQEQRQRVRGDVVGRLRRSARVLAQVRVALPLEQRLGEAARRLLHPHDQRPGRVARPVRGERRPRALDLDLARAQHLDEPPQRRGVALLLRDHERVGLAPRRGAPVHPERRAQPVLAVLRRVLQDRERGLQLGVDDVGEPPGAARPGSGEVRGSAARVVLRAAALELLGLELQRRRDPRRGGLRQDAHAAVGVGVGARRASRRRRALR